MFAANGLFAATGVPVVWFISTEAASLDDVADGGLRGARRYRCTTPTTTSTTHRRSVSLTRDRRARSRSRRAASAAVALRRRRGVRGRGVGVGDCLAAAKGDRRRHHRHHREDEHERRHAAHGRMFTEHHKPKQVVASAYPLRRAADPTVTLACWAP